MRIVTVTHYFEKHGGGIERVAGHVCRQLFRLGHESVWVASSADAAPDDLSISAVPIACIDLTQRLTGLPMPIPTSAGFADLKRAIDRADALVVHDALYLTSIAAVLIARAKGIPVILLQHIAQIEFSSYAMRTAVRIANRLVTRPMLGAVDKAIFISDTVRAAFADVKTKSPAQLVFNGVDNAVFHRGRRERLQFSIRNDERVALFVGRFVEKKGLTVLRCLASYRPDVTFILAGSGPINPVEWNLQNIRLLGTLKASDIAVLMRAADLLILPSVGEGFPLVLQEAMACGLPAICGEDSARADPCASRWLRGVPIDLSQPEKVARNMSLLLDRPLLSAYQCDAMSKYATKVYSWTTMAETIAAIASDLINSPPKRPKESA